MKHYFSSLLPMQLGIVQISLKSSAIRSHCSEVGAVTYIGCSTFQVAFPVSRTMSCTVFFPTRKKYLKYANESPVARHLHGFSFSDSQKCKDKWHNLRSNYKRKEENIPGSGDTVKGKWPYYDVMNFLEYYLQRRTVEMFQRQQLQLHSLIQMKIKWTILNNWKEKIYFMTRKWTEVRVKKNRQQELKEEGKYKN